MLILHRIIFIKHFIVLLLKKKSTSYYIYIKKEKKKNSDIIIIMKPGKEKQHIQSRKEQKRECGLRSKQGRCNPNVSLI